MKRGTLALAVALTVFSLSGCSLLPEEETFDTAPVIKEYSDVDYTVTVAQCGDIVKQERISTYFSHAGEVTLSFEESGLYYDQIYVAKGDPVKQGDLLATLKSEDLDEEIIVYEREIERTELLIRQANERGENTQTLEDTLASQNLHLEALQKKRADRCIYAPFDGTITSVKTVTDSELSSRGVGIIKMADLESAVFVCETDLKELFTENTIYSVSYIGDIYEATFLSYEDGKAYLKPVDSLAAARLTDGATCSLTVTAETRTNVLRVPTECVFTRGDDYGVYIKSDDGLKQFCPIEIGLVSDDFTEVLSGLNDGDEVIIE